MPSRVICVSSQPVKLLTIDNGRPKHGRYAALSYCWGAPQPMRTTKANLATYTDAIPYHALPQTIKDAVITTRGLGLDYLWVDALCIVQDDEDDRTKELPLMAQIYNSSYVTISAATAATCLDGFLVPRKLTRRPIRLRARCPDGKMGSVLLVPDNSELYDDAYPINRRAWTLQEHLLAPRVLMFGPTRARFVCLSKTRFDGGWALPSDAPQTGMPALGRVTLFASAYGVFLSANIPVALRAFLCRSGLIKAALKFTDEERTLRQALVDHWADIVRAFTSRSLGFPGDRLPAISGIAEAIHCPEMGEYLAGLYANELHPQLVWRRAEQQPLLKRPDRYRAPSWSWAAIDGAVEFPAEFNLRNQESLARILECRVIPRSEREKYIAFSEGCLLRISGKTALATFSVDFDTGRLQLPSDIPGLTTVEDAAAVWRAADVELLLLEVMKYDLVAHGLLLQALENNTGMYTRVGYFVTKGPYDDALLTWTREEVSVV